MIRIAMTLAASTFLTASEGYAEATRSFSTGGHSVYHVRPATVNGQGGRALIGAAYDGMVLCLDQAGGTALWKTPVGGFPFDLAVADLDGDGWDECLIASSDGALYALDHDGARMWTFQRTAPLYQVCVATLADGTLAIAAGGVEQTLHLLSPNGQLLRSLETEDCIRHVRAGRFLGEPGMQIAVATASSGLSGRLSLMLLDPATLEPFWRKSGLGQFAHNSGRRFFSMASFDTNNDGADEILLSHSWGDNGRVTAYDGRGNEIYSEADPARIPRVSYRMNLLAPVELPNDRFILDLFANMLILHNADGTVRQVGTARYAFANLAFDPVSRRCFLAGETSGGDGIYSLALDQPDWMEQFEKIQSIGRLAEVETNLDRLRRQVAEFQPPAYQPRPRETTVIGRPADRADRHVRSVRYITLSQKVEDPDAFWCREQDKRQKYDMTAEEIIAAAQRQEAAGEDFVVWAGHGTAAFMPLETMQAVLRAAPQRCFGFAFAEMEKSDERMAAVVGDILAPLARSCREHGRAKIVLQNKNIFYNGSCYIPFWKKALLDSGFSDVFLPSLEETNCRTQELSLAGRMGLWLTGYFDQWSERIVTDNACFDRMWEWSSQQVLSHHMRHFISRAAQGADAFSVAIHQGPFSGDLARQMNVCYDMLEKGIVHVPSRDELLSVSPVCLGMKSPPSPSMLQHGKNGHGMTFPRDSHPPLVFDRLDTYWGGAPTLEHDFSRYALGVQRRMTNFLPQAPYGMVVMIPDEASPEQRSRFSRVLSTDGERFFDEQGQSHGPAEYAPTVEKALREAAAQLPILVQGEAHWAASRLDASHIRVTLIDPGYVDPAERAVAVVCQTIEPVSATDILSRESLPLDKGAIRLAIPAGSMRVIDIAHK